MHINFALILIILTVITGMIALFDKLFLARRRQPSTLEGKVVRPKWIEFSYSFFPVFLLVLVLRSFLFEPFRIPSGSLEPTLLTGDFVLVNKFQYGLRWPVINHKFVSVSEPQQGDIAVFHWPEDPRINYIKRIVGVPGDHIEYRDKQLYVNSQLVPQEFIRYHNYRDGQGSIIRMAEYEEQLNGKTYRIYQNPEKLAENCSMIVLEGHYFALGDNRDDSRDSREWGVLDDSLLVGKAFAVWMSWDKHDKRFRWERIPQGIE